MPFRVVLDTNVYYSAFVYPNSSLATIVHASLDGVFITLISPSILSELTIKLRQKAGFEEGKVKFLLENITSYSELILIRDEDIVDRVRDIDDNHIVACAIVGKADLIVTGDKDLYTYKSFDGIGVSRPADFIRTLNL